jgi:Zn-dependent peptidase ImmA (M78 family)/transcriptional regulator with XRE-family HTH domain
VHNPVNPEILVLARESRGLSQLELARAVRIAQGTISKYENGLLQVSEADLSRIATFLDYDQQFFLQRARIYGLGSSFLFNRRRRTAPVRIQKRVQAQVNILRLQVERLLRGAEVQCDNRFEFMDIDEYGNDPALVARRVRLTWQLPAGPVANVTRAIENAGGIVLKCDFLTQKIDAVHLWTPGMPPLFFMNADVSGERHRFSLCHELGHALMHRFAGGDIEREANEFASEFLMPAAEIGPCLVGLTLERAALLKQHWKASMQAIIRRAHDLRKISARKYRRLFTQLGMLHCRRNEPYPVDYEEPSVVKQLVEVHRKQLGYGPADLRRLLFTRDPQFFPEDSRVPSVIRLRHSDATD